MNKMAAAFLSLFSLILILGVLYVTSPTQEIQVSKMNDDVQTVSKQTSKEQQQLASENSSTQQKVEELKDEMLNQQNNELIATLEQTFTNDKQQCEVTINEKNVRIVIKGIADDQKKAEEIMKEAYNLTKHKYFIEVAFQEK